jgi:beta-lactamase class A
MPSSLPASTERAIRARLSALDGHAAVAARALPPADWSLLIRAHEPFHAASTMKTPVMVECYRRAHEGRLDLDASLRVENSFRSVVDGSRYKLDPADDSHSDLYEHVGEQRSIRALLYAMITASSNLATNLLIERVGAENVTRTMHQLGATGIQVRRGVEDTRTSRQDINNTTTAHGLLVLFDHLARGTVVNEEACAEMIQILTAQEHDEIIPARLPETVEVAHKTGWITGVRHDSGIVSVPGGPTYVLVLLSRNLADVQSGVDTLADVSRLVFDAAVR